MRGCDTRIADGSDNDIDVYDLSLEARETGAKVEARSAE